MVEERRARQPWWVETIKVLGLPTVLVVWFLGQDAGLIPSLSQKVYAQAATIDTRLTAHEASIQPHIGQVAVLMAQKHEVIALLRLICRNQANTQWKYNECNNPLGDH